MKAYFFQRIFAYAIDILIITLLLTLIGMIIPVSDNYLKLQEEQLTISESYLNQEISADVYVEKNIPVTYDLARENFVIDLVRIVIVILYFVVFQIFNKGQTIGKKLLKIEVVRLDGKQLQVNDLIIRSVILYEVIASLLTLSTLLFLPATEFFYVSMGIYGVQMLVVLVILGMICFRKDGRGLHDILGKTKVVLVDRKELVVCEN